MLDGIRDFIQRGRKGYATSDLWQFDHWLSALIARGLKEFKQQCHTYPNDLNDWQEWMSVLDEMIECFEEQSRSIDNIEGNFIETYNLRMDNKRAKLHRGLELLEKHFFDLWN